MYSYVCLSSVYENWFLDLCISAIFEFSGNKFELGKNKFERERETIIFSIWQWPFKSVIIFRKSHNISERYKFCTRKHIEVGLEFSLAAGSKMSCISVFMFFPKVPRQFFTLDTVGRHADKYITRRGKFFLCFYVSMFAYMNRVNQKEVRKRQWRGKPCAQLGGPTRYHH